MSRYVVGIDLGTTHCALSYVDTSEVDARPKLFPIPQLVGKGSLEARPLLPSFLYVAHTEEGPQPVPWDAARRFSVGEFARSRGADAPSRVVSSAKSWLSHAAVDRRSALLPMGAPDDVEKISPVEASFRYLEHMAEAWDAAWAAGDPACKLSAQEVVLTVPASFDAAARELTVEAALAAGIENLTLLEEPQAALYAWIDARGDAWRKELKPGDLLLVVDIGGGTTDLSAIAVRESGGALELERVAVGDHILLGGDNMDLTLSYLVRQKLTAEGKELDSWQMGALMHGCRAAKEALLTQTLDKAPIVIPSRGSKLLGGSIRTELTQAEVTSVLVEGFFPTVGRDARPQARTRAALTSMGLAYASDPAITKHLAAFLSKQAGAAAGGMGFLEPTCVLFNGGVMKGSVLRGRVLDVLGSWMRDAGREPPRPLEGGDLDLAVARGAAAYGMVRRGKGVRIRGGTARAYYVGIESAMPAVPGLEPPITALCVAPFGMEEGTRVQIPAGELGAVVGEPVRFRFFGSTTRRQDKEGARLERWQEGELDELSPIEVTLPTDGRRAGDIVQVHLESAVTEVGTLELSAVPDHPKEPDERWKVELSVREG